MSISERVKERIEQLLRNARPVVHPLKAPGREEKIVLIRQEEVQPYDPGGLNGPGGRLSAKGRAFLERCYLDDLANEELRVPVCRSPIERRKMRHG